MDNKKIDLPVTILNIGGIANITSVQEGNKIYSSDILSMKEIYKLIMDTLHVKRILLPLPLFVAFEMVLNYRKIIK